MTTAVDDRTTAEKAYDDRVAQVAKETAEAAAHMPTASPDPRTAEELKTDRAITVLAENIARAHVVDTPNGQDLRDISPDFAMTNMAGALNLVLTHSAASADLTNQKNADVKDYTPVAEGDVIAAGSTTNPDGPNWGPDAILVPLDLVHERAQSDGVRAVLNIPAAEQPPLPAEEPTAEQTASASRDAELAALKATVAKQAKDIKALQDAATTPAPTA